MVILYTRVRTSRALAIGLRAARNLILLCTHIYVFIVVSIFINNLVGTIETSDYPGSAPRKNRTGKKRLMQYEIYNEISSG